MNRNETHAYIAKMHGKLSELINELREDIQALDDPQAKALFETSAEVLSGLRTSFEHFETNTEAAWKNE